MFDRMRPTIAVLVFAMTIPGAGALAHATLDLKSASPGSFRAAVRVPHGCAGSPTVAVSLTIPEGVIGVKPAPKPGWTVATTKGAYAKTYDHFHGKKVSDGVKEIVWRGGPLLDEHFDEFIFTGFITGAFADGETVPFPIVQDCEQGQVAWTELAAPGANPHDLKYPAPLLKITAKPGAEKPAAVALSAAKAWARATPGGAKVGAGYLEIVNATAAADTLLSVAAAVAGRTEIHEMTHDGGVMKMRALTNGLDLPAGATVSLSPGGLHIMFLDLKQPLTAGQTFDLELTFKTAGKIKVPVTVAAIGANGPATSAHEHQH